MPLSVAVHIEKLLSPGFVVFGIWLATIVGSDLKINCTIILFRCEYMLKVRIYTAKVIFVVVT